MSELFSKEWMQNYVDAWNNEPGLADELAKIGFSSAIGYGLEDDADPKVVLTVENGKAVSAEAFSGQELNWDLRASTNNWVKWIDKPPGMMGLGMAYTSRKLKFNKGDYAAMIKDPRMAAPFIKSFAVMGRA